MAEPSIPSFYYLQNFLTALLWVQARYADLLSVEELGFIREFQQLPQPSQALLVRMVMRKGEHFRASKLNYDEIGDIHQAAIPLCNTGWVRPDAELHLYEVLALLRKAEALRAFDLPAGPRSPCKADLLPLLSRDHPAPKTFQQWCPLVDDPVYSLTINALCERLRLLFFGNLEQSWAEFVLADLGIFRYEQVPIAEESRGFASRAEVEQYLHLWQCRAAFDAGEPIEEILAQLTGFEPTSAYLNSRHNRLLFKLARQLEREGRLPEAVAAYRRCGHPGARQRLIRTLEKQHDYHAAHALALAARQTPESDTELQLVERAIKRLAAKTGQPRPAAMPEPPAGRIDLLLPREQSQASSVEYRVREHLHSDDAPVHYVENGLINSLFGLLCWEAIFAPLPGAFFHPFHSGPVDLHEPEFRLRRAELFDNCFAQLNSGDYQNVIRRTWKDKYGIQSPFVFWGLLDQALLDLALHCLPASHLQIWFDRLLADIRANRTGMPDLIQFWPAEQRYRMIEVKGPGDRLQDNQRRWLAVCAQHAMPVDVCYVQWATT
ncbi:VRR-NUC domain-containing protein [Pseudomonas sp. NyZ704]|nr:VRR-NUC domain-containing protein [Pseudomonas sp. NyZ704]